MDNESLEGLLLLLLREDDAVHQSRLCTGKLQSVGLHFALLHRQMLQWDDEEDAEELFLVRVTSDVHTD